MAKEIPRHTKLTALQRGEVVAGDIWGVLNLQASHPCCVHLVGGFSVAEQGQSLGSA